MRRGLLTIALLGLCAGAAVAATGCYGTTSSSLYVHSAPPAPAVTYHDSRDGYTWVQGHWAWTRDGWVWHEGYWIRNRPGYVWVQGYWDYVDGSYVWVPGTWTAHRAGHVWISGYWGTRYGQPYWVRGRWVRERPGYNYVDGRWVRDRSYVRRTPDGRYQRVRDHRRAPVVRPPAPRASERVPARRAPRR